MPLDPPAAGSIMATEGASSSARLKASTLPMSGRGAPSFTATPIPTRASGAVEPAATLPLAVRSASAAGVSTTKSKGSPPSMRRARAHRIPALALELGNERHHDRLERARGEHLDLGG